jgi:DNA-binding response OmpR family regulator
MERTKPTILVADETGVLARELESALGTMAVKIVRTTDAEDCVEKARSGKVALVVAHAAMPRAFSLLRLLRHSQDLAPIPLVVVGEPGQEELIVKHRKLPSRADRYVLRPLDFELTRGVVSDLLGGSVHVAAPHLKEATQEPILEAEPLDGSELPEASVLIEEELKKYRARVLELERDLGIMLKTAKEAARARADNARLKEELEAARRAGAESAKDDQGALFRQLEEGYKETIADLDRLLAEKDDVIARLAASDGHNSREETAALSEEIELARSREAELNRILRQVAALAGQMQESAERLGLAGLLHRLEAQKDIAERTKGALSFDEATLVVEAETLRSHLEKK